MSEAIENSNNGEEETCSMMKMSHKKWRALIKKQKRKVKRQAEAKRIEAEQELEECSPTKQAEKEYEERQQQLKEQYEEKLRYALQQKWLEREYYAKQAFKQKQIREKREKERLAEQERKIREEWEEQQKKEENQKEEEEKKKQRQEELLKEATKNEKKGEEDSWHNPLAPKLVPGIERENCPFFIKVGACRFGDRCSRGHPYPDTSTTIMLPGMYTHYKLEHSMKDEYDTDLGLEYEDSETYSHFKEFYRDTLPEFKKFGRVIQYKVCSNFEPHLRGNVYVQYDREEDALRACAAFHCRYYGGRQLNCHMSVVETWKQAICGLYYNNRCPKGRTCNFMHAFPNPGNAFKYVQKHDINRLERLTYRRKPGYRYSRSRSRSRSRSPRWRRRRHRSRSYERSSRRSYGRSRRSRTRSRSPKPRTSRRSKSPQDRKSVSRSRSKSPLHRKYRRTRSRSPRKQRSRSPQNRYKSKSPSPERRGHRSKKQSRYQSKSPEGTVRYSVRSLSRDKSQSRSVSISPEHCKSVSSGHSRSRSPSPFPKKSKKRKKSKKKTKEKSKSKTNKDKYSKDEHCIGSSTSKSNGQQSPSLMTIESGSETSRLEVVKPSSVKELLSKVENTEVTDATIIGDNIEKKDKALEFLDSVLADIGSS